MSKKGRARPCETYCISLNSMMQWWNTLGSICWHLPLPAFCSQPFQRCFMGFERLHEKVHLKHAHVRVYKIWVWVWRHRVPVGLKSISVHTPFENGCVCSHVHGTGSQTFLAWVREMFVYKLHWWQQRRIIYQLTICLMLIRWLNALGGSMPLVAQCPWLYFPISVAAFQTFRRTAQHRGSQALISYIHTSVTSFESFQCLRTTSRNVIAMLLQLAITARRSSGLSLSFCCALDAHGCKNACLESASSTATKGNMSNAAW